MTAKNVGFIFLFIILFVPYFYMASNLNFYQNDDFYYYLNLQNFLKGNFTLHPKTAPTFYLQGLIALSFVKSLNYFGFVVDYVSVLTMFISFLNGLLFFKICKKYLSLFTSFLVTILFAFNPLVVYLYFGFMTEPYFLFFTLLSFLCVQNFDSTAATFKKFLWFLLANIVNFCALFIRQLSLIFTLSLLVWFIFNKNYRYAFYQICFFILNFFTYEIFLKNTPEMLDKQLKFSNLLNFEYSFSLLIGILLYICAFYFSLFFLHTDLNFVKNKNLRLKLGFLILSGVLVYVSLYFFKPLVISWGEFPYFENTFERTGFLPREVHATKYGFYGIYDLYYYWELFNKCFLVIFIFLLALSLNKFKNFYFIYFLITLVILIVTPQFFDRYLILVFLSFILFFVNYINDNFSLRFIPLILFCGFIYFFSLAFSLDFFYIRKTIYQDAKQKNISLNIPLDNFCVSTSWNRYYNTDLYKCVYLYSYDATLENYMLVQTLPIKNVFKVFIKPTIYLHKDIY